MIAFPCPSGQIISAYTKSSCSVIGREETMIAMLSKDIVDFWRRHPALLYGSSALVGASFALFQMPLFFLAAVLIFLLLPLCFLEVRTSYAWRLILTLALGTACFFFTANRHQFPNDVQDGIEGVGHIEVSSLSSSSMPFGPLWMFKGTLLAFYPAHPQAAEKPSIVKNIPIRISLPKHNTEQRPLATHRYFIPGHLKKNERGGYAFFIKKNASWNKGEKIFGLAEWRFAAKKNFKEHLHKVIEDKHVAAFLSGIVTGEFDDLQLSQQLGRFGLQHLMAISGLHFSLLASMLAFTMSALFSKRLASVLLIILLSTYFIFLGNSPSILRAWIAISLLFVGQLFGKRSSALNTLGVALLVIVLLNPISIQSLGFQFSFAITAAILLGYVPCDLLLQKLFAKRTLSHLMAMPLLEQHGYLFLCFLRQALSLSLAINIIALPLTLFYFQTFPLLSLIYNLFFPFMFSFSMLLLVLACFWGPLIPWLSIQIHGINESYTHFLLNFAFNLPRSFDVQITYSSLSAEWILLFVFLAFVVGILAAKKTKEADKLLFY